MQNLQTHYFINPDIQVTIITPNMHIIQNCLHLSHINLIIREQAYGVLSDNTIKDLENYHIGKAFMSCSGILKDGGIGVSRYVQKKIKETVMNLSQVRYLLAESSKFNAVSLLSYDNLSSLDALITDNQINEAQVAICNKLGVTILN